MSLRSRIESLEGKHLVKAGYDFHYLIYVNPDGSPRGARERGSLADALEARAAGYRVSIQKYTLQGLSYEPWEGLLDRLRRCADGKEFSRDQL
jgi:hypothetical protein